MSSSSKNQRPNRQPRFKANPHAGLKVHIPQSAHKQHLIASLSFGGFGIYCTHREAKLIQMGEIDIVLGVEGKKLQARGSVQYFKCLPGSKPGMSYYLGIRLAYDVDKRREWRDLVETALEKGFVLPHAV